MAGWENGAVLEARSNAQCSNVTVISLPYHPSGLLLSM